MKMRIKEFAEATGVSVRTLHYYDEIGLLPPACVDRTTGYRYYDENSLLRLQEILFYRELDFPLKSIARILSSPHYDKNTALRGQKKLLTLKKERLERLISAIDGAVKGENVMKAFDHSEFEKYRAEAREKWDNTAAYRQYEQKAEDSGKHSWQEHVAGMDRILAEFTVCMTGGESAGSARVQELVKQLQNYITENFYDCTDPILAGLGRMYVADERFRNNIDKHGAGTAEFVSRAIGIYCGKP